VESPTAGDVLEVTFRSFSFVVHSPFPDGLSARILKQAIWFLSSDVVKIVAAKSLKIPNRPTGFNRLDASV
jgi:hypothetical protein